MKFSKPTIGKDQKNDIVSLDREQKKKYRDLGESYLSNHDNALIIFAGGMGNRANAKNGKQFIPFGMNDKTDHNIPNCLFDMIYQKIIQKARMNKWKLSIYIVCNKANRNAILDRVQEIQISENIRQFTSQLPVFICFQDQFAVMNKAGLQNIYVNQNKQLTYPNGIGRFPFSEIKFNKNEKMSLKQHLQINQCKYLYGIGISNLKQSGIDPLLIGMMQNSDKLDTVFKCFEPKFLDLNCPRVLWWQSKQKQRQWAVMQYENLIKITKNKEEVQKSPVWCDHFVVNIKSLLKSLKNHDNNQLKFQYHDRILKNSKEELPIIIGEYMISRTIMNEHLNSKGLLATKQQYYQPLITQNDFLQAQNILSSVRENQSFTSLRKKPSLNSNFKPRTDSYRQGDSQRQDSNRKNK